MKTPTNKLNISVIVPVYNVAQHISKCVKSLLNQSIAESIEFIFVNDDSNDNSIEVLETTLALDEYKHLTSQIKIVQHNENLGLNQARRTGLNHAKGRYITFCDSDDWIDTTLYQDLYEEACKHDLDIVGCDFIREYNNGKNKRINLYYNDSTIIIRKLLRGTSDCSGSVCTRLVRRDLYISCIGNDEPRLSMYEDLLTSIRLHLRTNRVGKITNSCYHYRTYMGSMSSTINIDFVESSLKVVELIEAEFIQHNTRTMFEHDLDCFKLRAKLPFIYYSNVYDRLKWLALWPDITIYKYPHLLPNISIQLEKRNLYKINQILIRFRECCKKGISFLKKTQS